MSVTHLPTDDPTLVNRYLDDQLTDAEREAFEARMVEDPVVLQELEATARLKLGMEKLRKQGRLNLASNDRSRFRSLSAIAAAVTAVAVGTLMYPITRSVPGMAASPSAFTDDQGSPLRVVATHSIARMRSNDYDVVIPLPTGRELIELKVLPDERDAAEYRVTLRPLNRESAAADDEVRARTRADGRVFVYIDSSQIQPGGYELALMRADRPGTELQAFRLGFEASEERR